MALGGGGALHGPGHGSVTVNVAPTGGEANFWSENVFPELDAEVMIVWTSAWR